MAIRNMAEIQAPSIAAGHLFHSFSHLLLFPEFQESEQGGKPRIRLSQPLHPSDRLCPTMPIFRHSHAFLSTLRCTFLLQSFPSHHAERFFGKVLKSYPGFWAATAASYCPSRAGELPKQNMTKPLCMMGWETL